MKKITLVLSLLSLALVYIPFSAQAKSSENLIKARNGLYFSGPLIKEDDILYTLGLEYRFTDTSSKFEEVFAEFGLGYKLADNVTVWAGINSSLAAKSRDDSRAITSQTPYQQIVLDIIKNRGMVFTSSTRFEEEHNDDTGAWKFKYRQKFIAKFPNMVLNKYSPIIYNDTHFNIGGNVIIPENRTFVGAYFPVTDRTNIEIGYLNQQLFTVDKNIFVHNAVLNFKVSTG